MRRILITGATDGIGRRTAEILAGDGVELIVHGRDAAKLRELAAALADIPGAGPIATVRADLGDLDQVRAMIAELDARFDRLDVLINNAGVFMTEQRRSPQGHELTWAVNVLAPVLLTHALLPRLRASPEGGRVIDVASVAHLRGTLRWDDFDLAEKFSPYMAYAQSKLALVMLDREFALRLAGHPVAVSLHPGVVTTKLLRTGFGMEGPDSLAEGAATSVWLARVPIDRLRPHTGDYFVRREVAPVHPLVRDESSRARLYALVCAQLGIDPLPPASPSRS
ncbi:SDR family NAD(P)-dependent oxidoreductase [Nannocystaceae bacterium ST9]